MTLNGMRRLCTLFALLWAVQTQASTVEQLDLEQLTERADRIYLATTIGPPASVWRSDTPATRLRLALSRVLKGGEQGPGAADTIEVFLPGGTIDGIRQEIVGMPRFTAAEEVVLFLSAPDAAGRRWPIGLAQAKFRVERQAGRPARVTQALGDLHLVPSQSARRPVTTTAAHDATTGGAQSLDDFLRQIERHLDSPSPGGVD